jgi:ABC-type Fe3+-hydroxamate transport system substrate-binding protein
MNLSGIYRTLTTLAAVAAVAAVTLTGCGSDGDSSSAASSAPPTPDTFILNGYLSLTASIRAHDGQPCSSHGGYSDIAAGTQVVVTDSAGKVVAVGSLDAGRAVGYTGGSTGAHYFVGDCRYVFVVPDVPEGPATAIYGIEVSHRGVLNYPRSDLDDPVKLTLGN